MPRTSLILALLLVASCTIVASLDNPKCVAEVNSKTNETASLNFLVADEGKIQLNGLESAWGLSACQLANFTPPNGTTPCQPAYIIRFTGTNYSHCGTAFDTMEQAAWKDNVTTTVYYNANGGTVTLHVKCKPGLSGVNPRSSTKVGSDYVLNFDSETVCPGYVPPPPAPAKDSGLKTGSIIGIVIGGVAVVVLVVVIFRWKTGGGSAAEGEYSRV